MMPGISGLEVARQAHHRWPGMRIIALSMYDTEAYVVEALQAGASAYVLKKATSRDLIYAVQRVMEGGLYLSPPLDERAIETYVQHAQETRLDPYESLTDREREVLQLVAEGMNNPEIAARLQISARTVEMHRANLMHKLSLKTKTELIRYALRRGILAEE
jgi:DNA-binding NarL/FixJ family response regulator